METFAIMMIVLMILGLMLAMILGLPMRKHLLKETEIKRILLFQMPFYLKDYNKMIEDTEDPLKKSRYRLFFILFMLSSLLSIIAGILLLFSPESTTLLR
jgi:hypothetical protein